jgi:hypothetical protein
MNTHRTNKVQLRFRHDDWRRLHDHLFASTPDEHGAALLCGQATINGSVVLLVREVILAEDGTDYVPGTRGYRHLSGEFVTHALRRAKNAGLIYLAVHNHGGTDEVGFSEPDMASHERGYPTLLALNGAPVGGLVLARHALAGDIWFTDGDRRPIHTTIVVGPSMDVMTDGTRRPDDGTIGSAETHARQALIFGDAGNDRMKRLKVGIVGAGGIGMLIIQALSRLGIGEFVIIDPDYVSITNLSRLPEATTRDATGRFGDGRIGRLLKKLGLNRPTWKVDLAGRVIRGANPAAVVTGIRGDVADDHVARQLLDCDFIFLAADTMLARDVVNQIAYQYLVPTLQVGSKVVLDKATGTVLDIYGVIRSIGVTAGCMRCNGLVNLAKLNEESIATDEQRRNQKYVDEPGVHAPSVITLNALSSGWAVNDFMLYASGLGRPATGFRLVRNRPVKDGHPHVVVQKPAVDPTCYVCGDGPHSVLAYGDGKELPTRV